MIPIITKPVGVIVSRSLNNKHTSLSILVLAGCEVFSALMGIWQPHHKEQVDATVVLVQKVAVAYGLFSTIQKPNEKANP